MTAMAAAMRLTTVLETENAALRQLDIASVSVSLTEKLAATEALEPLPDTPDAAILAQRLQTLIDENRRLLERAIAVQSRVVEVVARAAQLTVRDAGRYGATGAPTQNRRAMAIATNA